MYSMKKYISYITINVVVVRYFLLLFFIPTNPKRLQGYRNGKKTAPNVTEISISTTNSIIRYTCLLSAVTEWPPTEETEHLHTLTTSSGLKIYKKF